MRLISGQVDILETCLEALLIQLATGATFSCVWKRNVEYVHRCKHRHIHEIGAVWILVFP